MDQPTGNKVIPERLQQIVSLILTILAALLYASILGSAIVKTALGNEMVFNEGVVQVARVLSGLVGSVVSAGFARSWRPGSVPLNAIHPIGGRTATAWFSLKPPSRFKSKLSSLAQTLGLLSPSAAPARSTPDAADEAEEEQRMPLALRVALLYFIVYFLVGIGSFGLILFKSAVPELIENSAWVWLGTVMASGYAYFGLDSRG